MRNMSYCRFENTYQDLKECYDALSEVGSIEKVEENANQHEKIYIHKLVKLCKKIFTDFYEKKEDRAFLVRMKHKYGYHDIIIFSTTEKCAIGKAKRKFPYYEICSTIFIKHYN